MGNIMRREHLGVPSLFRKSINDMFDHFSGTGIFSPLNEFNTGRWTAGMPLDVIDQGKEYVVKANLPGLTKSDVDIQLLDNVLTIKGSYNASHENSTERYLLQERRTGCFARSIAFNEDLVAENITATFKDGILTITVPKAEVQNSKSFKIEIAD